MTRLDETSARILLIEDESALRLTLGDRLKKEGYTVDHASDGVAGLDKASTSQFDLIVLDIMLPELDGFAVCKRLRSRGVTAPVLMLTARSRTQEKVTGLEIGADDYVTKPFRMAELLARINALLRRVPSSRDTKSDVHTFGDVRVDLRATEVTRGGQPVELSSREFALLRFFIEHPGLTLSRKELLTRVWGYHAAMFTRTVDVHVASLRQKIEDDPRRPRFLLTVQRLGYKFKP
jgi:two-component system alkaline phosphatase synthesis response regulator PhoP